MVWRLVALPFLLVLAGMPAFGQSTPPDLSIVLDSTFTNLKVGQFFSVTGRVQSTGDDIPSGQVITATVEFVAPDGFIVFSHQQNWNGFPEVNNANTLRNDEDPDQVLIQFPWNQALKDTSGWEIRARVSGADLETNLSNNFTVHDSITMDLPDLIVVQNPFRVFTDLNDSIYLPNSVLNVEGEILNRGQVRTQQGIQFPVVAELRNQAGVLVESESVIVPSQIPGGFPSIEQNGRINFSIGNIHLPEDTSPGDTFTLRVVVDPNDQNFNGIVPEVDGGDNHPEQEREISFTISSDNPSRLEVDPSSFVGDVGAFSGLDPIRISFTVRNNGLSPVQADQSFFTQVVLSKDLTFDNNDFVLREFDLSGDALGANLLPRETITLDWIQQLPDNIDGDFYFLVNMH